MASSTNRVLCIFTHANWNQFEQMAIKHPPGTVFHNQDISQHFLNNYLVLERMNFRRYLFNNNKNLRKVSFLYVSDIKNSIDLPGIQDWCYNELGQWHGIWKTLRFHSQRLCKHYGDSRWKRTGSNPPGQGKYTTKGQFLRYVVWFHLNNKRGN